MSFKTALPVLVALSTIPVTSGAGQCVAGSSPVTVSGRVTTLNISTSKQVGQLCLTLVTADGREVFDDCGAVVGKTMSMDPATGASVLSHTALFEDGDSFRTVNDAGQVTGVLAVDAAGAPCEWSVQEHISELRWGRGAFSRATLDVWAGGSVSFCPGKNLNTLVLNGRGCIRNRQLR